MPELRFNVGDNVICNMGEEGWIEGGVVTALWWRSQESLREVKFFPYLVDLPDRRSIIVPYDEDDCIRSG